MTISELRAVLDASMTFPRADERNKPVLDFVDLTVAVWDAAGAREGGGGAGWVVDVCLNDLIDDSTDTDERHRSCGGLHA